MDTINEEVNDVIDVENNDEDGEGIEDQGNPFAKKARKQTSKVQLDMKEVIIPYGTKKVECIHCKTRFAVAATGVTTHLRRHLNGCLKKKNAEKKQKIFRHHRN